MAEAGQGERLDLNYQSDGFDQYLNVVAQRSSELVVSFTDTADQPRTQEDLRASGARPRAVSQAAEARQN